MKAAIVQQERTKFNLLQFRSDFFAVHLAGEKHDARFVAIKRENCLPFVVARFAEFKRFGFLVEFAPESLRGALRRKDDDAVVQVKGHTTPERLVSKERRSRLPVDGELVN